MCKCRDFVFDCVAVGCRTRGDSQASTVALVCGRSSFLETKLTEQVGPVTVCESHDRPSVLTTVLTKPQRKLLFKYISSYHSLCLVKRICSLHTFIQTLYKIHKEYAIYTIYIYIIHPAYLQ